MCVVLRGFVPRDVSSGKKGAQYPDFDEVPVLTCETSWHELGRVPELHIDGGGRAVPRANAFIPAQSFRGQGVRMAAAVDDAKGTFANLEARIGHRFSNPDLLREALTHTIESPRPGVRSNARLAFLGDAVVKLIVSEALYRKLGDAPQGVLTEARVTYERKEPQAAAARSLGLDRLLTNSAGKALPEDQLLSASAPATAYEAVVAAVYLDGDRGPQSARDLVRRTLLAGSAGERLSS